MTLHSCWFVWLQAVQHLPLLHFVIRWGLCVVVHCIMVIITMFFYHIKTFKPHGYYMFYHLSYPEHYIFPSENIYSSHRVSAIKWEYFPLRINCLAWPRLFVYWVVHTESLYVVQVKSRLPKIKEGAGHVFFQLAGMCHI